MIYIGKAKNLRSRASSYFHKAATEDRRIADWIPEVADVEYLAADSEVDALLMEAQADQGHPAQIQPRPQRRQDIPLSCRSRPARIFRGSISPGSRSTEA